MLLQIDIGLKSIGPSYYEALWTTCSYTQKIALIVIPIGIMAQVGMSILDYLTGDGGSWNLKKVLGSIVVFFFVVSFQPIMKLIDSSVDIIEGYLRDNGQVPIHEVFQNTNDVKYFDQNTLQDVKEKIDNEDPQAADVQRELIDKEEGFSLSKMYSEASDFMSGFFSIGHLIVSAIGDGITGIVRMILYYLQIFLLSALLIVGPLAAMVSTMPFVGDGTLKHWFKTFLNFKFWGVTCAVIDILMDQYLKSLVAKDVNTDLLEAVSVGFGPAIVANLCFIIMFIMVPKITSWYIGGFSDSGMSAAIGAGTTIMNVGSSGAQIGAAVASGGLSAGASMAGGMLGGGMTGNVQNAQMMKTFQDLTKSINTMNEKKS